MYPRIISIYPNKPTKYTAQLVGWFFFGSFLILKGAFLNFLDDGGPTGGPEAAQLGGSGTRWRRNAGAGRGVQDDFSLHSFAYQWAVSDIQCHSWFSFIYMCFFPITSGSYHLIFWTLSIYFQSWPSPLCILGNDRFVFSRH